MKRFLFILTSIACLGLIARGEDADARDQLKEDQLPNYEQARDPFWPIGYQKRIVPKKDPNIPDEPETPQKIEPKWPKLKLKAVTSSPNGYIAIIEGIGLVEKGQAISKTVDGVVYRWRVNKITDKGFSVSKIDAKPAGK